MIPVLKGFDYATAELFVDQLNKERLRHKQQWITYVGTVAGRSVSIKSFDTGYLQILRVNGIEHGGAMDLSVSGWKHVITKALQYQHPKEVTL
jgi:hypothetical protein